MIVNRKGEVVPNPKTMPISAIPPRPIKAFGDCKFDYSWLDLVGATQVLILLY